MYREGDWFSARDEHRSFHYYSPYEQAKWYAEIVAYETNDERPWLLTDFDTWIPNPNYKGPPNPPHPEDGIDG